MRYGLIHQQFDVFQHELEWDSDYQTSEVYGLINGKIWP